MRGRMSLHKRWFALTWPLIPLLPVKMYGRETWGKAFGDIGGHSCDLFFGWTRGSLDAVSGGVGSNPNAMAPIGIA
jgi:hypothetical protein